MDKLYAMAFIQEDMGITGRPLNYVVERLLQRGSTVQNGSIADIPSLINFNS